MTRSSNEYMRAYMGHRYRKRREQAVSLLGGECVKCGATEELEFDHIEPATKDFTISEGWSMAKDKFWAEVAKCQLLCTECHKQKHAPKEHGTLSMYRHCKCDRCRRAKSEWQREYMRRRSLKAKPGAFNAES